VPYSFVVLSDKRQNKKVGIPTFKFTTCVGSIRHTHFVVISHLRFEKVNFDFRGPSVASGFANSAVALPASTTSGIVRATRSWPRRATNVCCISRLWKRNKPRLLHPLPLPPNAHLPPNVHLPQKAPAKFERNILTTINRGCATFSVGANWLKLLINLNIFLM